MLYVPLKAKSCLEERSLREWKCCEYSRFSVKNFMLSLLMSTLLVTAMKWQA